MDTGLEKNFTLKSILFIMFANLKLVLRSYTSLYGIFMSASLTLYIYNSHALTDANPCINNAIHTMSMHGFLSSRVVTILDAINSNIHTTYNV